MKTNRLILMIVLIASFFINGYSQDNREDTFVKFIFKAYFQKYSVKVKELKNEYLSKKGVLFAEISEKGESVVIAKHGVKFRDISDVAGIFDCKIEIISETPIDKAVFDDLMKK